jgi:hypothetical protein
MSDPPSADPLSHVMWEGIIAAIVIVTFLKVLEWLL